MNSTLFSEQEAALAAFANRNGRTWKSKLRDIWMTGHYSSDDNSASLQQVRNQFGPSWLVNYKLPKYEEPQR
jgi:hypothetical protein